MEKATRIIALLLGAGLILAALWAADASGIIPALLETIAIFEPLYLCLGGFVGCGLGLVFILYAIFGDAVFGTYNENDKGE